MRSRVNVCLLTSPAIRGLLRHPDFILGLVVGAWVDRTCNRRLLVVTGLVRALVMATVPAAALLHVLRLEYLFVVAVLAGSLALAAEVGQRAYMSELVQRDDLVDANSKMTASSPSASLAGPAAGGALSALLTAPVALAVDSASLVAATTGLWTIRRGVGPPVQPFRQVIFGVYVLYATRVPGISRVSLGLIFAAGGRVPWLAPC